MFVGIGVGVHRQRFAGSFATSYSSRVIADGGTIEALDCVAAASSLLQSASLLIIPSGYKAGVAYAELPANGNGDLTWSRNSVANRTQSNGNIGSVAANVPRLSYMYGSCPALLLEPQRTNLCLYSEQFNNAFHFPFNLNAFGSGSVANTTATVDPNGLNFADYIQENTSASVQHSIIDIFSGNVSGTTYTWSVFAKAAQRTIIQLANNGGGGGQANYNLTTGVASLNNGVSASMQDVGNGWYRCILSYTSNTTGTHNVQIRLCDASGNSTYTGNGTSGVFIWGAQLEVGAYSTTYIQTTNAAATRLVDSFTRNNIYTNGLISASGGTWYLELKNNVAYTRDSIGAIWIGDNSTSSTLGNAFNIRNGGTARLPIGKTVAGVYTGLYTTLTDNVKIAIKWNGTTADVFVNGVKVVSATAFTATNMEFLNGQGTAVPIFIQAMALYPTPLSDTDCTALTT